jgi:hypothetical protein
MERSFAWGPRYAITIVAIGALMAWSGSARDLLAQGRVRIRGRVLDEVTRTPVAGAFVGRSYSDSGVLTDSLGLFTLELLSDFSYPITVENLGYRTLDVVLSPTAPEEFTTILISPDPIAIQGLRVLVDRFARRRRTYAGPVRAIDQDRLLNEPSQSAFELLRRSIPFGRPCRTSFEELCTVRRGREQVVTVCIDERPAFAGARELELFDVKELYLVELYGWGSQVRVYSRWYVDRLLSEGRTLRPLSFGC